MTSLAKKFFAGFLFACVLVSTGYAGLSRVSAATAPRIIMYQGRLLNSNGVPVSDATSSILFKLFDASSGGTCLWSNNSSTCISPAARTVTLTAGLFSEPLGDTAAATPYAAIPATVFQNNASVYLEITVGSDAAMSPRKQMLAAPYAMNSDVLDGYDSSTTGGTSSIVPVTDANGNLVVTGAPQGTGVNQGSLYINPASTTANFKLFGIAVGGVSQFDVDKEGDVVANGDMTVSGGDIVGSGSIFNMVTSGITTLNLGSTATTLNLGSTATVTNVGAGSTNVNIGASATAIAIGGVGSGTAITGNNWSIASSGLMTTANDLAVNGGDITSSALAINLFDVGTFGSSVLNIASTGTTVNLGDGSGAKVLDIGGVTADGTDTISIATNGTSADIIAIGNTNAATAVGIIGGTSWSIGGAGLMTTANDLAVNGGDITSTATTFNFLNAGTPGSSILNIASTGTTVNLGNGSGLKTINIGGGAGNDGTDTVNISTNNTSADTIVIGNTHASTSTTLVGGTVWSIGGATGLITTTGSVSFGDTTGTDEMTITSATGAGKVLTIDDATLTTGSGILVRKSNNTSFVFDGTLADIQQLDAGAGDGGRAINVIQNGNSASAVGLYITQAQVSAHGADVTGANALDIDIGEAGSATKDAIILRANVNTSAVTTFRVTSDGHVFSDFGFTGSGADFAEYFPTNDNALTASEMVCSDVSSAEHVKRCEAGETNPMGVISTNPVFIGNNGNDGTEDLSTNPNYRLVGLVGQIDTLVDTSGGAIAVGDAISTSSTTPGYGTKAHGPARIVGFALESLSSGTGIIRVLIQPQWYGGDVLTSTGSATQVAGSFAIAAVTSATASTTAVDSASLSLNGSSWNGSAASAIGMSMKTAVNAVDDYRLSIMNGGGAEVASVNNNGDFALTGKFYPSDRGAAQYNKYIYYDGSSGAGGDFMRTNAAGWSTGSYDFAEMFPSPDALVAGEVVTFGDVSQNVKRSNNTTYNQGIAGIVSTRPGFLAGENAPGNYPIALSGRVPTLVSSENGTIAIGDPLTTSTKPGYAMRATEAGPILGYAAEAFNPSTSSGSSTGRIIVYVNVSYYGGPRASHGAGSENTISALATDISHFDTTGTLNFNGGQLLAVGSMTSASGAWRLESGGDLVTSGRLVELVHSADGTDVRTYPATSTQTTLQLAGTATLVNGHADVRFSDVDAAFTGIIDPNPTYRALVTPYGATGTLYVTNRTVDGFSIVESGAASNGIQVDWLVMASRRDFAPVIAAPIVTAPIVTAPIEPVVVPTPVVIETPSAEPTPIIPDTIDISASAFEPTVEAAPVADVLPVEPASAELPTPVTDTLVAP